MYNQSFSFPVVDPTKWRPLLALAQLIGRFAVLEGTAVNLSTTNTAFFNGCITCLSWWEQQFPAISFSLSGYQCRRSGGIYLESVGGEENWGESKWPNKDTTSHSHSSCRCTKAVTLVLSWWSASCNSKADMTDGGVDSALCLTSLLGSLWR
jgi:hypothetical protein